MARSQFKQAGIILKTTALRESDLIVTILLKESGAISAIARGARKSKRRFMARIDLFDCGEFTLSGPTHPDNPYYVNNLDSRTSWDHLATNALTYTLASYCLEISRFFAPEGDEEAAALFDPLYRTLAALNRLAATPAPDECYATALYFNLFVLDHAGLNPLASPQTLRAEDAAWWEAVQQAHKPLLPKSDTANSLKEFTSRSFFSLAKRTEAAIGHELKTLRAIREMSR